MDIVIRSSLLLRRVSGRFSQLMTDLSRASQNFGLPNEDVPALVIVHRDGSGESHLALPEESALDNGFLWAVPTKRRTTERRMMRRYGAENWPTGQKLIKPKRNILVCKDCGHDYEVGTLCGNCLDVVMTETKAIQEAMLKAWGKATPIDQDVEVVYSGEEPTGEANKRLIEMDRPRPAWFHRNLMQRSMKPERSEEKTVRPHSDLIG